MLNDPHYIQTSIWFATCEHILTNIRWSRKGVGISLDCSSSDNEHQIWICLIPSGFITTLFYFD